MVRSDRDPAFVHAGHYMGFDHLMNASADGNFVVAILWCVGMLAVSYIAAVQIFKHKLAK